MINFIIKIPNGTKLVRDLNGINKKIGLNKTCLFTLQILKMHICVLLNFHKCRISFALNRIV